jgi:hypothetical protein
VSGKVQHFDDAEQSKLFIEKARELEADQEIAAADKLMGRLAKMPPQPHKKPKKRGRKRQPKQRK